jgi:hypothetical protein
VRGSANIWAELGPVPAALISGQQKGSNLQDTQAFYPQFMSSSKPLPAPKTCPEASKYFELTLIERVGF